jgi:hypothetical protein
MSTPRSKAIHLSKSNELHTVPKDGAAAERDDYKIEHYAYLGRLINTGIRTFFDDDAALTVVTSTSTEASLRGELTHGLLHSIVDNDASELYEVLNTSQLRRSHSDFDLAEMINAGLNTYADNTKAVYDILAANYGHLAARHPSNASILDRLSKLHVTQIPLFAKVYLNDFVEQGEPNNSHLFLEMIEQAADGGFRFKKGYPENAYIPNGALKLKTNRMSSYVPILGDETLKLKNIELKSVTIGCPISFEPLIGKKLWNLYAQQRYNILLTQDMGSTALKSPDDTSELNL